MSKEFINNLPIIAIMTPFILAFVLGIFKDKYLRLKKILAVSAILAKHSEKCTAYLPLNIVRRRKMPSQPH